MIRLPSDTKNYSVSNASDLKGTVWYTKNLNLDEEGYLKLSSRTVSVLSERDYANANLVTAFGRTSSGSNAIFNLLTTDRAYTLTIGETALSATQDSASPQFSFDSHARWYQNLWTSSETNDFFTGSGASWTDRGNLTTGKAHPVEVFRNRNTICIGDGNTVLQFDNTYTATTTLTLPPDFEVVSMAYANNRMYVLTMLSDTTQGQNQEAYFFVWDGATTSAEQGLPIGSDMGIAVVAYMGSVVILTRTGQLLYFTGGGFRELAAFPFYFMERTWGNSYNRNLYGDVLAVEGSVIYINFNGILNAKNSNFEQYAQSCPGGIWCYDPTVGLYHRYSPSISDANLISVSSANVSTSANTFVKTSGTIPSTGSEIKYTGSKSTQIGGLSTGTVYYCIKHNSTTFSLAETREKALDGVAIDITGSGDTTNYFWALEVKDYGQSYGVQSGAIALMGVDSLVYDHVIVSSKLADATSQSSKYFTVNLTIPGFENRGYFITPNIVSASAQDVLQKLFVSYRPLKDNDKIIYKIKDRHYEGLPVSTAQARYSNTNICTWSSTTQFYTSLNADLSAAKEAFDLGVDIECEIIAGAGAGTMAQIDNIEEQAGVYTVTLKESIFGISAGNRSDVIFDNWKVLGESTKEGNTNLSEIPSTSKSDWFQIKVELRGTEVAIFDQKFVNTTFKNAA